MFVDHSSSGCVSYTGIDKETGEVVDIGQWIFQADSNNDFAFIKRQINSIEQEVTYLLKLKHANLGLYYGIKYHTNEEYVIVNLLREYIPGKVITFFYQKHGSNFFYYRLKLLLLIYESQ